MPKFKRESRQQHLRWKSVKPNSLRQDSIDSLNKARINLPPALPHFWMDKVYQDTNRNQLVKAPLMSERKSKKFKLKNRDRYVLSKRSPREDPPHQSVLPLQIRDDSF